MQNRGFEEIKDNFQVIDLKKIDLAQQQIEIEESQKEIERQKAFQKEFFEKKFTLQNIQKMLSRVYPESKTMKEIFEKINGKSKSCTHQFGCIDNLYLKTLRGFLCGYFTYAAINILQTFKKNSGGSIEKILKMLFDKKAVRFSMFLTILNFGVNSIQCFLKNKAKGKMTKKEEQKTTFLAGFLAGYFALASQPYSSRQSWTVFTMVRAFDIAYQGAVNKGIIPRSKWFYIILFACINTVTVYAFSVDPSMVANGINKFYAFVFNSDHGDMVTRAYGIREIYKYWKERGYDGSKSLAYSMNIHPEVTAFLKKHPIE